MTVFVTQQPTPNKKGWQPDMSPAAEYGRIEFVFPGGEQVHTNPGRAIAVARDRLADFDPVHDCICWPYSGDPASLIATIMVLIDDGHDQITILRWNRNRDDRGQPMKDKGYYTPVTMEL